MDGWVAERVGEGVGVARSVGDAVGASVAVAVAAAASTTIVPVMLGTISQWYVIAPGSRNVTDAVRPAAMTPVLKLSSSAVAVWTVLSAAFSQTTASPAAMRTVSGWYSSPSIRTVSSAATG